MDNKIRLKDFMNLQVWKDAWNDPKVIKTHRAGYKLVLYTLLIVFAASMITALWHLFVPDNLHWLSQKQKNEIWEGIALFGVCSAMWYVSGPRDWRCL